MLQLVDWMIDFAQKRSLPTNILAKSYLTMLFTLISKVKPESSLLDSLALQLSHLFGSINEVNIHPISIIPAFLLIKEILISYPEYQLL